MYYFNESNKYTCTESYSCPPKYKFLISQKNKCIDECIKDDEYMYNYNSNCYKKCPLNTKTDIEKKECLELCKPNQIELNNICYNNFSNYIYQVFQKGYIFIDNLTTFDKLLNDIKNLSEGKNSLVIQRSDDIIYHITNSKNELELLQNKSNNKQNISIIDLGECETKLRTIYHIQQNDSLIIIKNEKRSNKASEKNINFEVYEPYNKTKLNLSVCNETSINIYVHMELNEKNQKIYEKMKESGYDMFNINDPFYQDICTPFDSLNDTDILLIDRINYIYNNDDTQCQSNCKFSSYSIESNYLNCSCSTNEDNVNQNNNKIDKFSAKKLYESFYDVLKYSNYEILKCFSMILDKNILKINFGSSIVIIYFTYYFVCFFIYIFRGIIPLKIQLRKDITQMESKNISNSNKLLKSDIMNLLYPPIKKKSNGNLKKNNKIINKGKIKSSIKISNKSKVSSNYISNKNLLIKSPFINLDIQSDKKDLKSNKTGKEIIIKKEYDVYELNELEYLEAIKYDKRSIFEIYWSTLKREHLLIFTFLNCNDYNLLVIKISRFIFLIVGDMALNVFFFSDDSMHKLFLNYGKYDFVQQIPQITYSTIISQLIEVFLCFLSLTDKYIYQIKSSLINGKINIIQKIIRCINLKLAMFFLFTFIFFIIYWYIISVFCAVYKNTQIAFIKDSALSFAICLIYPFFIYFLTSILRICSLRSSKKSLECIYKLSYVIPFF